MSFEDQHDRVLRNVQEGKISPEEGSQLLASLESSVVLAGGGEYAQEDECTGEGTEGMGLKADADVKRLNRWKSWWMLPFVVGLLLTVSGASWMGQGWVNAGLSLLGFWLSWIPFGIGLFLMVVSWYSRSAPWLHVRIRQKPGEKPARIAISLPIPLVFLVYVLRFVKIWLPENARDMVSPALLRSVEDGLTADDPFYVFVDDDDTRVEVFIG